MQADRWENHTTGQIHPACAIQYFLAYYNRLLLDVEWEGNWFSHIGEVKTSLTGLLRQTRRISHEQTLRSLYTIPICAYVRRNILVSAAALQPGPRIGPSTYFSAVEKTISFHQFSLSQTLPRPPCKGCLTGFPYAAGPGSPLPSNGIGIRGSLRDFGTL
jgi:hypothetical protein